MEPSCVSRLSLPLALAIALASMAGCNRGPRICPASGIVVFTNGKPVTAGIIEFAPVDAGPNARASIAADGSFTLKTGDREGAAEGKHKIAVIPFHAPLDNLPPAARQHLRTHPAATVHPKYARYETSGLTKTVEPDVPNVFRIEVEAK